MNNDLVISASSTAESSKRLSYLDCAKFIALFCVSYAHICGGDISVLLIDSFNLTVFFLVAGFTLHIKEGETFASFLKRKVKSYVIPIFCMDVLTVLIQSLFLLCEGKGTTLTPSYYLEQWIDILGQYRLFALWIVTSIFFSVLFTYGLIKLSHDRPWAEVLLLLTTLTVAILYNYFIRKVLYWNLESSFLGTFFLYLGYLLSHRYKRVHTFFFSSRLRSLLFSLLFLGIGFTAFYLQYRYYGLRPAWYPQIYQHYFITIPASFFSSYGILLLSYAIDNPVMAALGKANLVTLTIQQEVVMKLFRYTFFPSWWESITNGPSESFSRAAFGLLGAATAALLGYAIYQILIHTPLAFSVGGKRKASKPKRDLA